MRILAIDTALGLCSVAVIDHDAPEPLALEQQVLARGHAEALMPMVERAMARVEGGFASLERVAVTVGPGSFTGLRVGLSAARAIAMACEIPVTGVTTLAALCAPLTLKEAGRVVAGAIDARHGQIYFQAIAPGGTVLAAPCVISLKDAVRVIGAGPVSIAGPGALLLARAAWAIGLDAVVVDASEGPDIRWVARLGAIASPEQAPPRPLYIKPPDAQPQDNGRLPRA